MKIDLDDTGIGCDCKFVQARIFRWRLAFYDNRKTENSECVFDSCDEVEEIFRCGDWGDEDVQAAFARFDAKGGADDPGSGLPPHPGSLPLRGGEGDASDTVGDVFASYLANDRRICSWNRWLSWKFLWERWEFLA